MHLRLAHHILNILPCTQLLRTYEVLYLHAGLLDIPQSSGAIPARDNPVKSSGAIACTQLYSSSTSPCTVSFEAGCFLLFRQASGSVDPTLPVHLSNGAFPARDYPKVKRT